MCGGAELAFFAMSRALAARADVHLALSRHSLKNPIIAGVCSALRSTPIQVHHTRSRLNPGTLSNLHRFLRRRASGEITSLIHALAPDLVLVNLPTVERGQAIADAVDGTSPRPPLWGFLHLTRKPSTIGAKAGGVRDLLTPKLIRRFDRLLTVSHAGARELAHRYQIALPDVVYAPTPALRPLARPSERAGLRQLQRLPNGFLLGMVGRVKIHHKGQDVALRVAARLVRSGRPLHLIVVGDGPDLPRLERLAEDLRISPHVTLLGWRDDVDALIPLFDALVMPSRYEGLPQTAVQAATAHVPVVGYAVGGLGELLPSGFGVPYGDEQGLAEAVSAILEGRSDWPARELADRASDWCDPENVAQRVLTLAATLSPASPRRREC